MASRRLRIKGIANIPARKKLDQDPAPSIVDDQQHNPPITISNNNNTATTTDDAANSKILTENTGVAASTITTKPLTSNNDSNISSNVVISTKTAPPLSIRRRFTKPPVISVNRNKISSVRGEGSTIDSKTTEEKQSTVVVAAASAENNEKIIILDETVIVSSTASTATAIVPDSSNTIISSTIDNNDGLVVVPPPSPSPSSNKVIMNRSRVKAIPRLNQRKTSFSASESDDEARNKTTNFTNTNRHRNDSVCSTTSLPKQQQQQPHVECPSPQKPPPKEYNSVIQRKCRRTEQSRKLAEARRDFYLKFGNNKPDRQKLTMMDLIFYNPTTNLMSSHEQQQHAKSKQQTTVKVNDDDNDDDDPDDPDEETTENQDIVVKEVNNDDDGVPAPQIKINSKGEIIIDEQSLVIENNSLKESREAMAKSQIVDGDYETTYGIYKRAKRTKDWPKYETLRFYKALNIIGTDFTLMCDLFPNRSRRELKMKFKKEERINRTLIDRAVMEPLTFKFDEFKNEVDMEERELMELERQKQVLKEKNQHQGNNGVKRKAFSYQDMSNDLPSTEIDDQDQDDDNKVKSKRKKRTPKIKNILDCLDDDDDDDESNGDADQLDIDDENKDNNSECVDVLRKIQKPTRYGRIPKILKKYDDLSNNSTTTQSVPTSSSPKNDCKLSNLEAGSLLVVANTDSNGEPVYKVYMFSDEQNNSKKEINLNSDVVKKLFHDQNNDHNIKAQNILTITGSNNVENNVTIPEEHNYTIPAGNDDNINACKSVIVENNIINVPEENVFI